MSSLMPYHKELTNGVGKCSVPMWSAWGEPAGFCEAPAYGMQVPDQRRFGDYWPGWGPQPKWFPGYCSGLACYKHGGPQRADQP